MAGSLLLIPCGARKGTEPAPARELYRGSLFRAGLNAAERSGYALLIVSARHGLVHPDTVLEPYEQRLTAHTADLLAHKMRRQADYAGLLDVPVRALLPGEYLTAARYVWPDLTDEFGALTPGRHGLGYQMQLLSRYATPNPIGAPS